VRSPRPQSVDDIKQILSAAQTPGPSKYNFSAAAAGDEGVFEDMIDEAIHDEYNINEQSFNPETYQQQQLQQQRAAGVTSSMQS